MSGFAPTCPPGDPSRDGSNLLNMLIPPKISKPIKIFWIILFTTENIQKARTKFSFTLGDIKILYIVMWRKVRHVFFNPG